MSEYHKFYWQGYEFEAKPTGLRRFGWLKKVPHLTGHQFKLRVDYQRVDNTTAEDVIEQTGILTLQLRARWDAEQHREIGLGHLVEYDNTKAKGTTYINTPPPAFSGE